MPLDRSRNDEEKEVLTSIPYGCLVLGLIDCIRYVYLCDF